MYCFYKQTHCGSSIDVCAVGNVINASSCDLVIVKGNYVEIFSVDGGTMTFEEQYRFYALIKSICCVRFTGDTKDSIMLGFDDSSCSIVHFDVNKHSLVTTAMFCFSKHYLNEGFKSQNYRYISAVDPLNRCAVMTVSESKLLVLPLTKNNLCLLNKQETLVAHRDLEPDERKNVNVIKEKTLYLIDVLNLNIKEIRDIKFLNGYDQPSILVLHTPERTWDGRRAISEFACELVAISLNLKQKSYAVFKRIANLPIDCQSILTMESIVDGALLFTPNLILHVTNEIDAAISLNDFGKVSKKHYDVKIDEFEEVMNLDHCKHVLLSENIVLVAKSDGDCYFLNAYDKKLKLRRASNSFTFPTYPSQIVAIRKNLLFISSHNGDSFLYKFSPLIDTTAEQKHVPFDRPNSAATPFARTEPEKRGLVKAEPLIKPEKRRTDDDPGLFGGVLGAEASPKRPKTDDDIETLFESESIFGERPHRENKDYDFVFHEKDALLNSSPVTDFETRRSSKLLELVTCSGKEKTGALNILYNGVKLKAKRPAIMMAAKKSEATKMFAARFREEKINLALAVAAGRTVVFEIGGSKGAELAEDREWGFLRETETSALETFKNMKIMLQVHKNGIRIVNTKNETKDISFGEATVECVDFCEPFGLVCLNDKTLKLLEFKNASTFETSDCELVDKEKAGMPTCFKLLCEDRMISQFTICSSVKTGRSKNKFDDKLAPNAENSKKDEEGSFTVKQDRDLKDFFYEIDSEEVEIIESKMDNVTKARAPERFSSAFFAFITRINGRLEVYSVPGFKRVFFCCNFSEGLPLVRNGLCWKERDEVFSECFVTQIAFSDLNTKNKLFLFILISNASILVYETFYQNPGKCLPGGDDRGLFLPLRLKRISSGLSPFPFGKPGLSPQLHLFENVCGGPGIFVSGANPFFLFAIRGRAKFFPLKPRFEVRSFAEQQNSFLLLNGQSEVLDCTVSDFVHFDCEVPFRRILIGASPAKILFHAAAHSFVVSTFEPKEALPLEYPTRRGLRMAQSKYSLKLFDSRTMRSEGAYDAFEDHEYVVCMANANLELKKKDRKPKVFHFVAVGTGIQKGEELASRGKIYIFSIERESSDRRKKAVSICKLFVQKHSGPVTAMATVSNLLAFCVGPKMLLCYWNGESLIGCAFLDLQFYGINCVALKNYLIVGDAYQCFYLILWEPKSRQLLIMSKDNAPYKTTGSSFIVNRKQMAIVTTDYDRNLRILHYDPKNPDNRGGKKLEQTAFFHSGHFFVKSEMLKTVSAKEQKHFALTVSVSGAIAVTLPINQTLFAKLRNLALNMGYYLEHPGGTNPRLFRTPKIMSAAGTDPLCAKNFADGDLIARFGDLDLYRQLDLAEKAKMDRKAILAHLSELDEATGFS